MANRRADFYVGTSGYQYDHWAGVFYPEGMSKKLWLQHYTKHFDTVEINNTFYKLPSPHTFDRWRDRAPPVFCYALKLSRYTTHLKHLKDARDSIGTFLERAERLRTHLGPILVQLPPRWRPDVDRLKDFLDAAPRHHRWAVELRDPAWLCEPVFEILRDHDAALVIHDMIAEHPWMLTAGWCYLRFHGTERRYGGSYPYQRLVAVARWVRGQLDEGRDVYAYFNNDEHGHAIRNALQLKRYVDRARLPGKASLSR